MPSRHTVGNEGRGAPAVVPRVLIALAASALAGCSSLGAVYGSASLIVANADARVVLPERGTEVPIRYLNGLAIIEARLEDGLPLALIVDSGSSGPILFAGATPAIDALPVEGTARFQALGSQRAQAVSRVGIDTLRIGSLSIGPLQGLRVPRPTGAPDGIHGVLGRDLFLSARVTLDFPARIARFDRPTSATRVAEGGRHPLRRDGLWWLVDARLRIDGVERALVLKFDTGCAREGIVWFEDDAAPARSLAAATMRSAEGLGGSVAVRRVRADALAVGERRFEPITVDLVERATGEPDRDYDGLLCLPPWSDGVLSIDAPAGWWSWSPD